MPSRALVIARGAELAEPPGTGDVEVLLRELVSGLELQPARPPARGRPPILAATCLWSGLLVCVLRGCSSQLALWRLLTQCGLWDLGRVQVSDQAIYHRLARAGTAPLTALFAQVNQLLAERLEPLLPQVMPTLAAFARDILVLDETTLDAVARRLPASDGTLPPARVLPGKLAGLFDVRRQTWRRLELIDEPQQNEKVAARAMLAGLLPGTLLLFDLGYFGFAWLDELTSRELWWVTRLRRKTSYVVTHIHAQHGETLDAIVWLGAYRADRAGHPVRLVQLRHGSQVRSYLTNVLDPAQLPLAEVVALYARRWDIEMAVQLVKQHLGLRLWWSCKPVVIQQQLWGVVLIAQILQALRLEIAARAGVEIFEVSLPLLVQYAPIFAGQGEDPVTVFVTRGREAGFIRPSRRIQPHAPDPPLAHAWSIGPFELWRTPRYAGKQ